MRNLTLSLGSLGCLVLSSTCLAQTTNWTQIQTQNSPAARNGHAMCYDSTRQRVVLFGGSPGNKNDTWEYDGVNWTQMNPKTVPPGRFIHAMAYDSRRKRTVMFGGAGPTPRLNDTWEWDGTNWTQIQTKTSPSVRGGHAMAYNFITGKIVMHGGTTDGSCTKILAGTWEYDGKDWTQATISTEPPARARYGMSSHGVLAQTLVFGGLQVGSCTRLNDTWQWDGKTWKQFSPKTSPPVRGHFAMADDTIRRRVVLFSGTGVTNDTWEWDGTNWTQMQPKTSPPRTSAHAMAYDSVRRRVVMFAGSGNGANTWEYGVTQPLTGSPPTISIATGGTQTFSLDAGTTHASRLYWVFGSVTGTTPGVNLASAVGSVNIPLNPDIWTILTIANPNTATLGKTKGTLDGSGKAQATFNIPVVNDPKAIGVVFYHAYLVYDAQNNYYMASNPVTLMLVK